MPMITAQFKEWLALAATEQTPGRPKSYELYRAWAEGTLSALDNLNIGTQPAAGAQATTPVQPPQPAPGNEKIFIGGQEIKPTDPTYDKIIAAVNG